MKNLTHKANILRCCILLFLSNHLFIIGSITPKTNWKYKTIHIFGDSHAPYSFTNTPSIHPWSMQLFMNSKKFIKEEIIYEKSFFVNNITQHNNIIAPFIIHWFLFRTMYRIGRDKIKGFNLKFYDVIDGDVVVLCFGSIDLLFHIYKQRDAGRDLDEIIDTLAGNYINTILENKKMFNDITIIVIAVFPPPHDHDETFLKSQVNIVQKLNEKLEELCLMHKLLFLNVNSIYQTGLGSLNPHLSDETHHIHPNHNYHCKDELLKLLIQHLKNQIPDTNIVL
jgi:hypothetical protein